MQYNFYLKKLKFLKKQIKMEKKKKVNFWEKNEYNILI